MGPANNLIYLLQHVSAVLGKQADQTLMEQLGIGLSQYRVLMVLEWNPRAQQRTIAQNLGQTEASISRQIKTLQERGLIISEPDPRNRRKRITAPTGLGMQMSEAAAAILRRSFQKEFADMPEQDVNQLMEQLQQLHALTCQTGKLGACNHPIGL